MNRKFLKIAGPLAGLVLFLAALWVLHHALAGYRYHDLAAAARAVPGDRLLAAVLLTLLNYAVLTGYDALAVRYVGRSLNYGRIAFASLIGYAFSNNIGMSMIAGSSVRYRLYTTWGLSLPDVTKMVAFTTLTLWIGLLSVGGVAFAVEPFALPASLHLPFSSARPLGILFLLAVAAYLLWSGARRKPVRVLKHEIEPPPALLSAAQVAISSVDWLLAGSVLYVLLPEMPASSFPAFLGVYLLAQVAGLVSQVPAGLGVFESVFVLLQPAGLPPAAAVGALLLYRIVYYLLPLAFATAALGMYEFSAARAQVRGIARFMGKGVSAVAPGVLSLIVFTGGALLLFSGATPELPARLERLRQFLPLPFLELSHFLGSLAGVALLLLARGIQQRLDAAYLATLTLLGAGVLFSLAKGLDYEEAAVLALMFAALLPGRALFYRRASLFNASFSPGWIAAIAAVVTGSVWLGFFSYRHVAYSSDLWWQFAVRADVPRFLRASVGVVMLAVVMGTVRLLRTAQPGPPGSAAADRDRVRPIVAGSRETRANLALLGDKQFLFSESGKSFIMYGIEGRSWIALGDPIGAESERKDLVWRFRELCDRHGGTPVFYEVGRENLFLYLDLGLMPLKIGEEAAVQLDGFSLEGGRRKGMRSVRARMQREGAVFSVAAAAEVPALLTELRSLSDAWLHSKNTREKRFSLGYFSDDYLSEFPCALVRKDGRILAFATIWAGPPGEELSVDLMRHTPDAPGGMMEYLFIELLLWGKSRGYARFNLGMAPLAGLEERALAPLWSRLGARIFRHGEHFYNFRGLRQFKAHFDPQWEPKYLVLPRGILLPRVLANLASLISGGLMGAIGR